MAWQRYQTEQRSRSASFKSNFSSKSAAIESRSSLRQQNSALGKGRVDEEALYSNSDFHNAPEGRNQYSTGRMGWMAHRKWKETKQQPGTAGPGNMLACCLISFHFLWAIHPVAFRIFPLFGFVYLASA